MKHGCLHFREGVGVDIHATHCRCGYQPCSNHGYSTCIGFVDNALLRRGNAILSCELFASCPLPMIYLPLPVRHGILLQAISLACETSLSTMSICLRASTPDPPEQRSDSTNTHLDRLLAVFAQRSDMFWSQYRPLKADKGPSCSPSCRGP